MLDNLLEEARTHLQREEYGNALEVSDELLKLEPEHSQALELRNSASEALEQQRRFAGLLAQARGYAKAQDFQACYQVATQALELKPGHPELIQLREHSYQALERSRKVNALLGQARQQVKTKDYGGLMQTVADLLPLEPRLPQVLELRRQAAEGLEKQRKLEEMLAEARGYYKSGSYEACCQLVAEALQLEPQHAELKELRQQAELALERAQKVSRLFEKTRERLQKQDYNVALETIHELLALDPEDSQALELQRLTSEALERRQRFEELLAAARSYSKVQNYEACYQVTAQALTLESEHAELKELHERASQNIEKKRKIEAILGNARRCLQQEKHGNVLAACEEVLQLEPEHPEAQELRRSASEALQRLRQFEGLLAAARGYYRAQDYEACYQAATHARELKPGHAELSQLRQRAYQALERSRKIDVLVRGARDLLQAQDHNGVIQTVEELLSLEPQHAEALDLRDQASRALERQRKLAELLAEAQGYYNFGNYEASYQATTEGLRLDPENSELKEIQENAHESIERTSKVKLLLEKARAQQQRQAYPALLQTVQDLLAIEPEQSEALKLQRLASEALKRRSKVVQLLAQARGYFRSQDFEACYRVATTALELEPDHSELKELHSSAYRFLEKVRQRNEFLEKVLQHRQNGDYESALNAVDQLLSLEPGHQEGLQLQQFLSEALKLRRKFEALLSEARRYDQAQDYPACYQVTGQALELEPKHPEIMKLREHAYEGIQRKRRVDELLEQARQQSSRNEFRTLLQTVQNVLSLEPKHPEALELQHLAFEGLERQHTIEKLLAAARGYYKSKDYQACFKITSQAMQIDPGHSEFRSLHDWAKEGLEKQ